LISLTTTMCIALITTSHPQYPLILASNRDEYLSRPTAPASFWSAPHTHVLGGRDLQRPEKGTWLGITRQGRIAVLTNFREEGTDPSGLKSRGGIVNAFLTLPPDSTETTPSFATRLVEEVGVADVGGFSLAFGQLRRRSTGLAIVSNRTRDADRDLVWIATRPGEVHGLSNSHYGDLSWPKVVHGEQFVKQLVHAHVARGGTDRDDLVERLFDVLSLDTLPKRHEGEGWTAFVRQLRNSIFIPRVGGEEGAVKKPADEMAAARDGDQKVDETGAVYATQKQTVILVDTEGHVTFVERTKFDAHAREMTEPENMRRFEFDIEGWNE